MNVAIFDHPARARLLCAVCALALYTTANAQTDHSGMDMSMPMPAHHHESHRPSGTKKPPAKNTKQHHHEAAPMSAMPGMAMPMPEQPATSPPAPTEASAMPGMAMPMNDAAMPGMEHASGGPSAMAESRTPIPPATDADRAAAFPPVTQHAMTDDDIHSYVLLDRLEAWNADHGGAFAWGGRGWIGTDTQRLWLRTEGERVDHATRGDAEILYGRSMSPWWDLVAGLRTDSGGGPSQTRVAIGVQGTAPGKFEVEATAYIGQRQRIAARLEAEYELLLTNRLILQPRIELDFAGRDDARRRIGSGPSTAEAGLRLRYEITRQFAPYVGLVREQSCGATARYERAAGESSGDTRVVAGLRIWF